MCRSSKYIFLISFVLLFPILAEARPVTKLGSSGPFIGGTPPSLSRFDITKEFKKGGKIYYQAKAIVNRASSDRNGSVVLYRANRWRDAFAELVGLNPGMKQVLDTFFPKSIDNAKFPPVTMIFDYKLVFPGKGTNSGKSKSANGAKKFVEPIEFGFQPGRQRLRLAVCGQPGEHPLFRVYSFYELISDLSDIPGWISDTFSLKGIGTELFKTILINKKTCANVDYDIEVLAKVPNLSGMKPSKAIESLQARNLGAHPLEKVCGSGTGKVIKQSVPAGKRVQAGRLVAFSYCVRKEKAPMPPANFGGTWKTNFGSITFVQDSQGNVAATYAWSGGGSLFGKVKGRRMSGSYINGNGESGSFSIRLSESGGSWSGSYRVSQTGATGKWSATKI